MLTDICLKRAKCYCFIPRWHERNVERGLFPTPEAISLIIVSSVANILDPTLTRNYLEVKLDRSVAGLFLSGRVLFIVFLALL